jgi:hypothetical protein
MAAEGRMVINIRWERKVGKVWSIGPSLGDIGPSVSCTIQRLTWNSVLCFSKKIGISVVVEHTANSSTWEADVGGSRLQSSLGFIMRTCTQKRQHKRKVEERILNIFSTKNWEE